MHPYTLDDISYFYEVFAQFGFDDQSIFAGGLNPDQITVDALDNILASEYQKDAMRQLEYWIYRDKAGESVNIIEHNHPEENAFSPSASWKTFKESRSSMYPLINLIKPNASRIVAQMMQVDNNITIKHKKPQDKDLVRNVNFHKDNILKNNNWDQAWTDIVDDAGNFGSGVAEITFEKNSTSMDINGLVRKVQNEEALTEEEYMDFMRAMYDHKIRYRNTFDVINCRHASGKKDRTYDGPGHRWVHINDTISVAKAKQLYREFADQIVPGLEYYHKELHPALFTMLSDEDVVSRTRHQVRYPVTQRINVPISDANGNIIVNQGELIQRDIMVEFVRLPGVGVVDITVDQYNHGHFTVHQILFNTSSAHSKGIGSCKFGLDGQKIYNMYHQGLLKYLGKQVKSGGIVDTRLGISPSQLRRLSIPGEFVEAKIPAELSQSKVSDLVKFLDPPSFPTAYPNMMALESRAVDESMSVHDSMKGIQQGTSGEQEDILTRQGSLTHTVTQKYIQTSLYPIAEAVFSNIVQFDTYPIEAYYEDPITKEYKRYELNKPDAFIPYYDFTSGELLAKPAVVRNAISGLQYKVDITTGSIMPKDPKEKAQIVISLIKEIQQTQGDPVLLESIKAMNDLVYNIPHIDDLIERMMKRAEARMQAQIQQENQKTQNENAIKQAELALKQQDKQLRNKQIDQQWAKEQLEVVSDKVPSIIPAIAQQVLQYMQQQNN